MRLELAYLSGFLVASSYYPQWVHLEMHNPWLWALGMGTALMNILSYHAKEWKKVQP